MCNRRMLGDGPSDWFWQHRVSSECAMWIRQVNIKSYTSIFSLNQHDATVAPTEELQKVQRWLTVNHQVVLHILQQQTGLCLFCLFCFLMKQTRQTATQERFPTAVRQKTAVVQTMLPAKAGGLEPLFGTKSTTSHVWPFFIYSWN